jgi:hypothetical protein
MNFLTPWDADCPDQATGREILTERRAEPVIGIRQHTAEANTGCEHAIDLGQRDLRLGSRGAMLDGTPARFKRAGSLVQLSGKKSRSSTMTGTSPHASVSDTNVWQLAVLPSDEAYCGATPTKRSPFFGIGVSSTTSTASLPSTRRSA